MFENLSKILKDKEFFDKTEVIKEIFKEKNDLIIITNLNKYRFNNDDKIVKTNQELSNLLKYETIENYLKINNNLIINKLNTVQFKNSSIFINSLELISNNVELNFLIKNQKCKKTIDIERFFMYNIDDLTDFIFKSIIQKISHQNRVLLKKTKKQLLTKEFINDLNQELKKETKNTVEFIIEKNEIYLKSIYLTKKQYFWNILDPHNVFKFNELSISDNISLIIDLKPFDYNIIIKKIIDKSKKYIEKHSNISDIVWLEQKQLLSKQEQIKQLSQSLLVKDIIQIIILQQNQTILEDELYLKLRSYEKITNKKFQLYSSLSIKELRKTLQQLKEVEILNNSKKKIWKITNVNNLKKLISFNIFGKRNIKKLNKKLKKNKILSDIEAEQLFKDKQNQKNTVQTYIIFLNLQNSNNFYLKYKSELIYFFQQAPKPFKKLLEMKLDTNLAKETRYFYKKILQK